MSRLSDSHRWDDEEWEQYYNDTYTGRTYNDWEILGEAKRTHYKAGAHRRQARVTMLCQCVCGERRACRLDSVRAGGTKRCKKCYNRSLRTGVNQTVFGRIQKDAAKRGYPFEITLEYVNELFESQGGLCALTGLPITRPQNVHEYRAATQTASLDRKDNRQGYVPGNVQWVHKTVNIMKLDHDQDEFVRWCQRVADHHRTPDDMAVAPAADDPNQPPVG